jgi:hypothetical protein
MVVAAVSVPRLQPLFKIRIRVAKISLVIGLRTQEGNPRDWGREKSQNCRRWKLDFGACARAGG